MLGYKLLVIEIIPNSVTSVFNIFFTINTVETLASKKEKL